MELLKRHNKKPLALFLAIGIVGCGSTLKREDFAYQPDRPIIRAESVLLSRCQSNNTNANVTFNSTNSSVKLVNEAKNYILELQNAAFANRGKISDTRTKPVDITATKDELTLHSPDKDIMFPIKNNEVSLSSGAVSCIRDDDTLQPNNTFNTLKLLDAAMYPGLHIK